MADRLQDRRRAGRPRITERRTSVSTWLPSTLHDQLISLAKKHDVSVSETVRRIVAVHFPTKQ